MALSWNNGLKRGEEREESAARQCRIGGAHSTHARNELAAVRSGMGSEQRKAVERRGSGKKGAM